MSAFTVLSIEPVPNAGSLVGKARLLMPSGMSALTCIFRDKNDPSKFSVSPQSVKTYAGGWEKDFATEELRQKWTTLALAAIKPRLAEILDPPAQTGGGYNGDF